MRADAWVNRRKLMIAGFDAVMADGPDVSARDIAGRAGLHVSTLYRNFGSADGLYEAIAVDGWERIADMFAAEVRFGGSLVPVRRVLNQVVGQLVVDGVPFVQATGQELGRRPHALLPGRRRAEAMFDQLWQAAQSTHAARPDVHARDVFDVAIGLRSPERWEQQLALILDGGSARGTGERRGDET